jgi:hypothetical protein
MAHDWLYLNINIINSDRHYTDLKVKVMTHLATYWGLKQLRAYDSKILGRLEPCGLIEVYARLAQQLVYKNQYELISRVRTMSNALRLMQNIVFRPPE